MAKGQRFVFCVEANAGAVQAGHDIPEEVAGTRCFVDIERLGQELQKASEIKANR